ncbi:MAG: hypothetical protein KJN79_06410 [Gammaproteobacteria bacterium]|nr:hypothetical protein [Gammaproteobacteria bacterium]
MNPNDMLFLTIPAIMGVLKFGLIAFAVVMLARSIFRPDSMTSPRPIDSLHAPKGARGSRA